MDLNYYRTVIAVADDCPVATAVPPPVRGQARSVAVVQYEMLIDRPHVHTQEDVLFASWWERQDRPDASEAEIGRLRAEFLARPQPCLRSSPLPKKYGWGLLFDDRGRVALLPVESAEYRRLVEAGDDDGVTVLRALRSRRA